MELVASEGHHGPHTLSIGPPKQRYVYAKFNFAEESVTEFFYKCSRGSENCTDGYKLWLRYNQDDQRWVLYDGPDLVGKVIPPIVNPIFTSSSSVLDLGWHWWRLEWSKKKSESQFMTTMLF